jgi:hypothetical protein
MSLPALQGRPDEDKKKVYIKSDNIINLSQFSTGL